MEKRNYVLGEAVLAAQQALEQMKEKKPGEYVSSWEEALKELVGEIRDREPFRYDPARDPLYRQAVDHYVRLGRRAMEDTMGRAAAMTGGYGNSYAETAGNQAYQRYLMSLSARMPQLQQLALQQYQARGQELLSRYQVVKGQEQTDFDRYRQAVDRYYGELGRLQNAYDRASDRDRRIFTEDRQFDYTREQDEKRAAWQAEEARRQQLRFELQQAYARQRDKIRDQQWQMDFEEGRRRHAIEMRLRQAEIAARAAAARRASSGGGNRKKKETIDPQNTGPNNRFSRDEYYQWRGKSRMG